MAEKQSRTVAKATKQTVVEPVVAPKLLSGGNPQIAKGYGDAPVQAYIAAMPGWKSEIGRRLDALISRAVPGVCKAVKWNSPFYGMEGQGWFLGVHCFNHYVNVAFFRGACSILSHRESPSRTRCATSTSARTTISTKPSSPPGWSRRAAYPASGCERAPKLSTRGAIVKATATMKTSETGTGKEGASPSQLIDARIEELGDWRGDTLARVRALIRQAEPEVVEEWKWRGVPVWERAGIICTGETYKSAVKLTFAKGAALEDPSGLFNSSLDGNIRRAIDIHEGDAIDEEALKALIRAAAALNTSAKASRSKK